MRAARERHIEGRLAADERGLTRIKRKSTIQLVLSSQKLNLYSRFEGSGVSDLQLDDLGRVQAAGILTWAEVNRTHRIRHGVYQRQGRLISLLTDFGKINPCYPDRLDETGQIITYTGAGRHGDQQLDPPNRALLAAIEQGHAVPLFNKLGVGRWQHTGFWRVIEGKYLYDEGEERMLWRFILERDR